MASSRATSRTSTTSWAGISSPWKRPACRARCSTSPVARATRSSPSPTRSATSSAAVSCGSTWPRAPATSGTRSPTSARRSGSSATGRASTSPTACAGRASTSWRASAPLAKRGGERQLDRNGRSLAGLAAGHDPAAERLGEAADDVEAETRGAVVARVERLEQARQHLRGDARAPVADRDANPPAVGREHGVDVHPAVGAVLERVVDEVLDDLLHLHAVAAERGQVARRPPRDEPVERRPRESAGLERREDVGQRERLDPERELAGLEAGDVERGAEKVDELDRLPLQRGRHLALLVGQRAERPFAEQARVADERVQRRTQIVRHGAERVALQAGDACQSSGLTRVRDGPTRLPGARGRPPPGRSGAT